MFLKTKKQQEELIAVSVALGLFVFKGSAALWTGTLSLLASSLDSLLDFLVSGVNLFALTVSQKEPDLHHPFGHEKAESLGGLFQSVILVLTAVFLIYSSIQRFHHPFELQHLKGGSGVVLISLIASLWLTLRLKRSANETGSLILKSDAVHYAVDLYSYGSILIAFALIQWTGLRFWDPLVTLPIALYLAIQGIRIGKEAIHELMDRESSPEIQQHVERILSQYPSAVVGMHRFKSRQISEKRFIQFHLEVKSHLSFPQVHEITEIIAQRIREEIGNVEVIIHPDPEGQAEDASDLLA